MSAPSRHAWLRAVENDPAILAMRADRRRNVLAAARILGWTSRDGSTRPTRSRTAARMGTSERTVTRTWRELERLGYLHCTEAGTSAAYRPGWHRHEGNLARTYTLVLPRTKENVAPHEVKTSCCKEDPSAGFPHQKSITDEGYRRVTAPFLRAGWLSGDIPAAVDAKPDGTRHAYDDPPRHPRAWMAWRLSFWLGPDGPLESPSQRRAAVSVRLRGAQDAVRAQRRPGTEPSQAWRDARAALRSRDTFPATQGG